MHFLRNWPQLQRSSGASSSIFAKSTVTFLKSDVA